MTKVVFHLPEEHVDAYRERSHLELYSAIDDLITGHGGTVSLVIRRADYAAPKDLAPYQDGNLHIIENGNVQAPGVLNATQSYIHPYWHLYPEGVLYNSPRGAEPYDATEIPVEEANRFFQALRQRLVKRRRSRYNQKRAGTDLPQGALAVFLQGLDFRKMGVSNLTTAEMLRGVIDAADGRPVIVKPHPFSNGKHDRAALTELGTAALDLMITDANIHDILAASAVTISMNSAVSLEGLLHRTPGILCAKSDFHHRFETVHSTDDFAAAIARAVTRKGGEAKYLYWYFSGLLNTQSPSLDREILARFAQAGFPPERLSLSL